MERVLNRPPAGSKPRTVKLKDMPVEERADRCQEDHMMWKCAYLSIMPNPDGSFTVWGGDSQHHVTIENGQAHCDCRGWLHARHHNCSHKMKWRLLYGDLKRK